VQLLLEKGASIDTKVDGLAALRRMAHATGEDGSTALHLAAARGYF